MPHNWVETTIDNICQIGDGNHSGKYPRKDEIHESGIPFIRGVDFQNGTVVKNQLQYILPEKHEQLKKGHLEDGDILFANRGMIGKLAIVPNGFTPANLNSQLAWLRGYDEVQSKMLYYQLQSIDIENQIRGLTTGTALKQLPIGNLKKISLAIPPLPEQQRIVAKLDSLFAHLEDIEHRIISLAECRNDYLLSCLVNSESGNFYARKKIGQYLEEGTERIGNEWKGKRLIGVSVKEGIIDLKIGQKKTFEKYKIVQPGDFIYNTMRVNIGSIAIYKGDEIALTSPDYVVFRVKEHLSPQLLLRFLKSEQGILEIGANTKGSVRARLYFKSLSEVRMPVAPEKVQLNAEKFLTTFSESVKKLNKLTTHDLQQLRQAILTKAFKGELVEQLPTDGSAEELLKEIKQLKNETLKKK